jgi:hypothetical protein
MEAAADSDPKVGPVRSDSRAAPAHLARDLVAGRHSAAAAALARAVVAGGGVATFASPC